jgi:hypothetical protein
MDTSCPCDQPKTCSVLARILTFYGTTIDRAILYRFVLSISTSQAYANILRVGIFLQLTYKSAQFFIFTLCTFGSLVAHSENRCLPRKVLRAFVFILSPHLSLSCVALRIHSVRLSNDLSSRVKSRPVRKPVAGKKSKIEVVIPAKYFHIF